MALLAMFTVATLLTGSRLVVLTRGLEFPPAGQKRVCTFEGVAPGLLFQEVIPSWNVRGAERGAIEVEIRAHGEDGVTKWYHLGKWSSDPKLAPRESVNGQGDEDGSVLTDTLRLKKTNATVDVRVTLRTLADGPTPELRLLALSFAAPTTAPSPEAQLSEAWGRMVDVPKRTQGDYPRGNVLCSPTSLSMVLWHYSQILGRPDLNRDVPEVEAAVWDPVYKGAGNWPFNTAFAGSFAGMQSYVTRFGDLTDLERWTAAGFPVICSVSFDLLRGRPLSESESGHLVVLIGFTETGDPVFNDPAYKEPRRVYKRSDFEAAWLYSKRTVYIVHPDQSKVPSESQGRWIEQRLP